VAIPVTLDRRHLRPQFPLSRPFPRITSVALEFPALGIVCRASLRRMSCLRKRINDLIGAHHHLGYAQPVGEQLKYVFSSG
jgi:hypothetical protein